jgi:hypothetical protein
MLAAEAFDVAVDATQRAILSWDMLRRAGNDLLEHEQEGCPPVLCSPASSCWMGAGCRAAATPR